MAIQDAASSPKAQGPAAPRLAEVLRKAAWRLVPFLCLLYLVNLLDRVNAGFARDSMEKDLKISKASFDWAYGIFYVGYLAFEVPANLLLRRIGARRWIARIMISWGLVTCATMAVTGEWSFLGVRILLGVAEAGFFPGIILYLTYWFPARERGRVVAWFMAANPITGVLGYPASGAIMHYLNGVGGLKDWQWLFLLEGIFTILIGLVVLWYLPDGPSQARWLNPEERDCLAARINQEERYRQQRHGSALLPVLVDWRVWLLICLYFTVAVGSNAYASWAPTLIAEQFPAMGKRGVGLLAALPPLCALAAMTLLGTHSDQTGERRGHVAFASFLAASGWALCLLAPSPWLFLTGCCLAQAGMMSVLPIFWTLPTGFLSGAAAAGGIALINSMGNVGGLVGSRILGRFGLGAMALTLFVGGVLALCVRHDSTLDRRALGETPDGGSKSEPC